MKPRLLVNLLLLNMVGCTSTSSLRLEREAARRPASASSLSKSGLNFQLTAEDIEQEGERLRARGINLNSTLLNKTPFQTPLSMRSLLLPTDWWRQPLPHEAVPADLLLDLDILQMVMERTYGGWELAESRGWNWNKWFEDWRAELKGQSSPKAMPLSVLLARFDRLQDFQTDNHTKLIYSSNLGSDHRLASQSAVLVGEPATKCQSLESANGVMHAISPLDAASQPKRVSLLSSHQARAPAWYVTYPKRLGTMIKIWCGRKALALQEVFSPVDEMGRQVRLGLLPSIHPFYQQLTPSIAYLRVPTLHEDLSAAVDALPVPESFKKTQLFIVDLRLNDGGWNRDVMQKFREKLEVEDVRHQGFQDLLAFEPEVDVRLKESCLDQPLEFAFLQRSPTPPQAPLQESVDHIVSSQPSSCTTSVRRFSSVWHYPDRRFRPRADNGPIFMMVVDNLCGSDCEAAVLNMAKNPNTVVVGHNTFGALQFIQPGLFMLPRTRVIVQMARGMSNTHGDHRNLDGRGLDVDILLKDEASHRMPALESLAQQILRGLR